jgi:hypothetical protein
MDITLMDKSAYTAWIINAIGFDADKAYIGQRDVRLKGYFGGIVKSQGVIVNAINLIHPSGR